MTARKFKLLMGLAILATPAAARPRPVQRPSRIVQLISMVSPPPSEATTSISTEGEVDSTSAPPLPPSFHVHDLSRQWVEFQMAERLTGRGRATGPESTYALNEQARASFAASPSVVPAVPLAIPRWMQSGRPYAAPGAGLAADCSFRPYRPTGFLRADAETRRQDFYGMMSRVACEHGIPVGLFDAMIIRESRYDPVAVSPKNAFGLTQLMPGTAGEMGVDRYDVAQNMRGGARYLRRQLDRYGQYHLALAAYNAGPGRVRGAVPAIRETRAYVDDILRNWGRLSGFEPSLAARRPQNGITMSPSAAGRSSTVLAFR